MNGYPYAGQASAIALPYSQAQLGDSRLPQAILDQRQAAQNAMAAATSTAPHSSMLASGLQALSGYVGGQGQQQADQAAAAYQGQGGQASPSVLAAALRGGPLPSSGADDGSMPPATGWAGVGQGVGQAAQAIGRKSDRRLKSDVVRVGALPNGLSVYRYRLEGGTPELGLMADEVMATHPEAVWLASDGFLRVDYSRAVL